MIVQRASDVGWPVPSCHRAIVPQARRARWVAGTQSASRAPVVGTDDRGRKPSPGSRPPAAALCATEAPSAALMVELPVSQPTSVGMASSSPSTTIRVKPTVGSRLEAEVLVHHQQEQPSSKTDCKHPQSEN